MRLLESLPCRRLLNLTDSLLVVVVGDVLPSERRLPRPRYVLLPTRIESQFDRALSLSAPLLHELYALRRYARPVRRQWAGVSRPPGLSASSPRSALAVIGPVLHGETPPVAPGHVRIGSTAFVEVRRNPEAERRTRNPLVLVIGQLLSNAVLPRCQQRGANFVQ